MISCLAFPRSKEYGVITAMQKDRRGWISRKVCPAVFPATQQGHGTLTSARFTADMADVTIQGAMYFLADYTNLKGYWVSCRVCWKHHRARRHAPTWHGSCAEWQTVPCPKVCRVWWVWEHLCCVPTAACNCCPHVLMLQQETHGCFYSLCSQFDWSLGF